MVGAGTWQRRKAIGMNMREGGRAVEGVLSWVESYKLKDEYWLWYRRVAGRGCSATYQAEPGEILVVL